MMADNTEDPPDSKNTTASSDYNTAPSEEEQITLFAPFEAHKEHPKKFQKSSETDSDVASKEIEFQSSNSQSAGNAKVLFRKLKAVMSSGASSASSYSPVSTPSPAQQTVAKRSGTSNPGNRPSGLKVHVNIFPPENSGKERSKYEGHSSKFAGNTQGGAGQMASSRTSDGRIHATIAPSDDPRISLTSYSDAHHHRTVRENGDGRHEGGGAGGGAGGVAVNKSEMLKRFGTIADSKVQV